MTLEIKPFDPAEVLETPEDVRAYLQTVLEDNDPEFLKLALKDIARSKGMTKIAKEANITRDGLYKALSPEGDPKLSTLFGILNALGMQISLKPIDENAA